MRILILASLLTSTLIGEIIDRTAIIVGKRVILDSDIDRDIRVTSFLNHERRDVSVSAQRAASARLIDQELIREQIRSGSYPVASDSEAEELLAQIKKDRFTSDLQYQQSLHNAGITAAEVKDRLLWQLTVLRFIDARFRPAVVISDQDVQEYLASHPGRSSLPKDHQAISDEISGERVNALLDDWLSEQRKQVRVEYLEKSLQ
jgi:hypothetical protein